MVAWPATFRTPPRRAAAAAMTQGAAAPRLASPSAARWPQQYVIQPVEGT